MLPAQDFRFALRTSMKNPGFTIAIVLILGVGIGANTAMFTLVNDILLKPLPPPDGHRIMHVGTDNLPNGVTNAGVSYPDFLDWRSHSRSFSGLALFESATFNVSDSVTGRRTRVGRPPDGKRVPHAPGNAGARPGFPARRRSAERSAGRHPGSRDVDAALRRRPGRCRQNDPRERRSGVRHRHHARR